LEGPLNISPNGLFSTALDRNWKN